MSTRANWSPWEELDENNEPNAVKRAAFGLIAAATFSRPQTPQEVDECAEHVAYAIQLALSNRTFGDIECEMVRSRWNLMVDARRAADSEHDEEPTT